MIKVLIVDDSMTFRAWLREVFFDDEEFSIVGEAETGREALKYISDLRPNVVVLDCMLPEMNGIEVTRKVMSTSPVAIVMLSTSAIVAQEDGMDEAIESGALFFFQKPDGKSDRQRWKRDLLRTCRAASRVPLIKRKLPYGMNRSEKAKRKISLVAIGASTGGPQTLANILLQLRVIPVPIVIVVHSDHGLPEQLFEWFSRIANSAVEIIDGTVSIDASHSRIYLAPSGKHVALKGRQLVLSDSEPVNFCKPSVDVLFSSLAALGNQVLGVLLTGMGKDGAAGLKKIREHGGATIVQDEASSIIFGMPRAAIEIGAAEKVLPANEIAKAIESFFQFDQENV